MTFVWQVCNDGQDTKKRKKVDAFKNGEVFPLYQCVIEPRKNANLAVGPVVETTA